jgi:CBS domain-containing protein
MQVSEILRFKGKALFTVTPETLLSDCVVEMAEHDVGSLVVLDDGELAGLLTFREVIRVLARRQLEQRQGPTPPVAQIVVRDIMNPAPQVASPQTDINELRKTMIEHHQRYMPVLDAGRLVGIVSFHDVARAVLEDQGVELKLLRAYIQDWPGSD